MFNMCVYLCVSVCVSQCVCMCVCQGMDDHGFNLWPGVLRTPRSIDHRPRRKLSALGDVWPWRGDILHTLRPSQIFFHRGRGHCGLPVTSELVNRQLEPDYHVSFTAANCSCFISVLIAGVGIHSTIKTIITFISFLFFRLLIGNAQSTFFRLTT